MAEGKAVRKDDPVAPRREAGAPRREAGGSPPRSRRLPAAKPAAPRREAGGPPPQAAPPSGGAPPKGGARPLAAAPGRKAAPRLQGGSRAFPDPIRRIFVDSLEGDTIIFSKIANMALVNRFTNL